MSLLLLTMLLTKNLKAEETDQFLDLAAAAPFRGVLVPEKNYRDYTGYRLKYNTLLTDHISLVKEFKEYKPEDCDSNFIYNVLGGFMFGALAVYVLD